MNFRFFTMGYLYDGHLIQSLPQAIKKNIEGREYTIDDMGNCGIADKW